MSLEAAPWLVVGLLVAGLIKVYVPTEWLTRFLQGRGGVVKAAFIGAPLPLCSCGVIPAALALRRQGASRGSVMSFLVATPETGADSIALSYALLGPFLAVVRPISAIFSAITTGMIGAAIPPAATATPAKSPDTATPASTGGSCCSSAKPVTSCCESSKPATSCCESEPAQASSCCESEAAKPEPQSSCCSSAQAKPVESDASCCSTSDAAATNQAKPRPRLVTALIEAAAEVLGDTMKWLVIGLFMAAAIKVFVGPEFLESWGSGIGVMVLMAVVGIPMYICAVASTPLAAGLLLAGLSPGAVLVFMLAGPATNIATLGVIRKEMGTRYMVAYLLGVASTAIACGLGTDAVASLWNINAQAQAQASHHHGMIPHWAAVVCLVLLILLAIKPLRSALLAWKKPVSASAGGGSCCSSNAKPAYDKGV